MKLLYIALLLASSAGALAQSLPPASSPAPAVSPLPANGRTLVPAIDQSLYGDQLPQYRPPADGQLPPSASFADGPNDGSALEGSPTVSRAGEIAPPPPVNLLSGKDSDLSPRESHDVLVAKRWIDGTASPVVDHASTGNNGGIVFRFGAAMPTVVCSPLFVCAIAFQPGESVNTVQVGDPVRWRVSPASSGTGALKTTHAVIKPGDIGLTTNLLVTTDRRTYALKLVSRQSDYMPIVSFAYPEDEAAAWSRVAQEREAEQAATTLPETRQKISDLDFSYRVTGDRAAWRPLRVYTDGTQTFIHFPKSMLSTDAPVLVALDADGRELMVNYRVNGDRYVVDKVLSDAVLISGVGKHQLKVKIAHEGEG